MITWFKDNLPWVVTAIVAPLITWFASRRHYTNIGIKKAELDVESSAALVYEQGLHLYQDLLDDVDARYKKIIGELREELNEEKILRASLELEIESLKARLRFLEDKQLLADE